MVESNSDRPPTLRSLTEMMSAAYTIHPAFAEASVVEIGSGLRPAFPDNLPRLMEHNGTLHLNGLYRHGFLLAPALAQQAARHFFSGDMQMNIIVNAEPRHVAAETLEYALQELEFTSPAIATAVNGCFIPRENYRDTPLSDGDRLEVLAPMQGG